MTPSAESGLLSMIFIVSGIGLVLAIGLYVWYAVALSRLFPRIGGEAWKGWVPVLNEAEILARGGVPAWSVVFYFIPIVQLYGLYLKVTATHRINQQFGRGAGTTVLAILLPPVWATILAGGAPPYPEGDRLAALQPPGPRRTPQPPLAPHGDPSGYALPAFAPQRPASTHANASTNGGFVPPVRPSGPDAPTPLTGPQSTLPPEWAAFAPAPQAAAPVSPPAPAAPAQPDLVVSAPQSFAPQPPAAQAPAAQTPAAQPPAFVPAVSSHATQAPAFTPPAEQSLPEQSVPEPPAYDEPLIETVRRPPAPTVLWPTPPAPPVTESPVTKADVAPASVAPAPVAPAPVAPAPVAPAPVADPSPFETALPAAPFPEVAPSATSAYAPPAPATGLDDDVAKTIISTRHVDGDDFEETVVVARKRGIRRSLVLDDGRTFALSGASVVIGRNPIGDPGEQRLAISDGTRTLSKTHARLVVTDDEWRLTDLNATNGVVVVAEDGTEVLLDPGESVVGTGRFILGEVGMHVIAERDS